MVTSLVLTVMGGTSKKSVFEGEASAPSTSSVPVTPAQQAAPAAPAAPAQQAAPVAPAKPTK
jgi:hypothetical protein